MTTPGHQPEYVFDQVQIGRGMRPLAQHGFITIDRGVLSLLGSDQRVIASAPIPEIAWKRTALTRGKNLSLVINGTKYFVSPGWGNHVGDLVMPGQTKDVQAAIHALQVVLAQYGGIAA